VSRWGFGAGERQLVLYRSTCHRATGPAFESRLVVALHPEGPRGRRLPLDAGPKRPQQYATDPVRQVARLHAEGLRREEVELVAPSPGLHAKVLSNDEGRRWRTEGRCLVREVEWLYEGRVPGRVRVHLEAAAGEPCAPPGVP
jgi:hypothetical protein